MSEPFLPDPGETESGEEEAMDVDDIDEPDVLTGPADDGVTAEPETPQGFRGFHPGDGLSAEQLEDDLG